MRIITPSVFLVALVLAGCVDDYEPLPPDDEIEPTVVHDELELTDDLDPLPDDDTCGNRKKADGACLP